MGWGVRHAFRGLISRSTTRPRQPEAGQNRKRLYTGTRVHENHAAGTGVKNENVCEGEWSVKKMVGSVCARFLAPDEFAT